jgi:hypothetical protein
MMKGGVRPDEGEASGNQQQKICLAPIAKVE